MKPNLSGKEGFPPAWISAPTMDTCPLAAAKWSGVRPLVSLSEGRGGVGERSEERGEGRRGEGRRDEGRRGEGRRGVRGRREEGGVRRKG